MGKTSVKVTKDPKRVEEARKGREKYINKFKKSILNDAEKGGGDTTNTSNETTNASNETTSAANTATNPAASTNARPNDTYVYGFGILAVLAIGVCLFFAYNTFQPKNKKLVNERQDQPPKRRHML